MSVRALTWSFGLRLDDMAAKSALHALADHADESGLCWPSMGRIARCMGCSESTARRAIHRLTMLELVACDQTSGGAGVTNRFVLNFGWEASQVERDKPRQSATLADCNPVKLTENPVILTENPVNVHKNPVTLTPEPPEPSTNRQGTVKESDDERIKLPKDWRPSVACRDHAADKGLDPDAVAEGFVDYFTEGKGRAQKRTHPGWDRRWRVWCNTDADRKPGAARGVRSATAGGDTAAFARAADRLGRG